MTAAVQEAAQLLRAGRLGEAAEHYAAILSADPRNFDALHGLGIVHSRRGDLDTAERLLGEAAALRPESPEILFNRGSLLQKLRRFPEALACFDVALKLRPGFTEALANRGAVLMDLGRQQDALADFGQVVTAKPALPLAWSNQGAALMKLGRLRDALASYGKAVSLAPDNTEARRARGWVLFMLRQYAEALSDAAWLTARDNYDATAWKLRGDILAQMGRREMAIESYSRAIAARPDDTDALANRGNNLFGLARFEDAAGDYATVVAQDADYRYALGNLLFASRCCCDWNEDVTPEIHAALSKGKLAAQPFQAFICCTTPQEVFRATKLFSAAEYPVSAPLAPLRGYAHERIRIGYLSANFHSHAVARLIAGVLEHHDRARFDFSAFSLGPDNGSMLRKRITAAIPTFVDMRNWDDDRAAQEIRLREIDVLVDLMGYTENARPGIVAQKPAPVQINYLGFPGTMAAQFMDYLIADETVIPADEEPFYSEKIIRLPHCYLPADNAREIATAPTRSDAGLPEQGFVFCCFNHSYKITPEILDVWAQLLRDCPGSVLWLANVNAAARRNLLAEARSREVDPCRIIFANYVAGDAEHLARLSLADLFLDTAGYNAHATASDALWAGVPVLTIRGKTFPSRVAASLLRAADMEELIAVDMNEYHRIARSLAADPLRVGFLKRKLAANRQMTAAFDTPTFARQLEAAYERAATMLARGLPPESFNIGIAL